GKAGVELLGDVHHERRANVGVEAGIDDLVRPIGRGAEVELGQSGDERGFVAEQGSGGVVGMSRLPIGKNQHARAQFANDARDLDAIFEGVLDAAVGNVERVPPTDFEDARRLLGLAGALLDGAARAHLALREVENGSAAPALSHLEQRAAAGLLDVVAVGGNGKDVAVCGLGHGSYTFIATATPSRSGTMVAYQ